jgi:uncharacterized membrane protein YeaQ/YmgE (transglycosylase-associated protein family)
LGVFSWIVLGLVVGLIARVVYSGPQPGGLIGTILLGIVGAMVGGWIGGAVSGGRVNYYNGLTFFGVLWAVAGALIVLFLWGLATGRKRRVV